MTGPVDVPMALIGVDDDSLNVSAKLDDADIVQSPELDDMATLGWPYPRSVHAFLAEKLIGAGARLVVFDMVFEKADSRGGDEELNRVLGEYPDKIVIASKFVESGLAEQTNEAIGEMKFVLPDASIIEIEDSMDPRVGYATFWADTDGVIRSALGQRRTFPHPHAPLNHSMAMAALKQLGEEARFPHPDRPAHFRIALSCRLPDGSVHQFEPIPYYKLFLEREWETNFQKGAFFKDKIVFLGGTSITQFHDVARIPRGEILGAQLQMSALAAALADGFYEVAPPWQHLLWIVVMALIAFGITFVLKRPLLGLAVLLVGGGAYVLVAWVAYHHHDYLIPTLGPLLTLGSSGVFCFGYQFTVEQMEKARLRRTLERQVSKELADHILGQPEDYYNSLPGVRKPVTILFSDIRSFTTRSEKDDPVKLVSQLKEYLDAMGKVVFENHGVVDKFIGDAVMAVWGNIQSEGSEKDARNAVRAAVLMMEELDKLNEKWEEEGRDPFAIGIGLNFGEAIFGMMGSEQKQEMTVIGDPVNQAARLEGLTKKFGEGIVIGEQVAAFLGDGFRLRELGAIVTKGKAESAELYGVLGDERTGAGQGDPWMDAYHEGLRKFRERDVDGSAEVLRKCAEERPDDKMCALYLEEIEHGSDGGALVMREK